MIIELKHFLVSAVDSLALVWYLGTIFVKHLVDLVYVNVLKVFKINALKHLSLFLCYICALFLLV